MILQVKIMVRIYISLASIQILALSKKEQLVGCTQGMHICSYEQEWTLTHRGRVTHVCVSNLTIIGSDNGLSPDRHQAII